MAHTEGWEDGSTLKSGGKRLTSQPARGPRQTPRIGTASNLGPQRDYVNELSNSSEVRIPTIGEVRRRHADEHGFPFEPMEGDEKPDFWEHQRRREIERDTVP